MNKAFTQFMNAVSRHVAAIKAEDKARMEMVAAVVDIFFGFTAPVFANWALTGQGRLSKFAEKVAGKLSKQGGESTIKLITEADVLKESLKAVGKIATTKMKLTPQLFGEGNVEAFAAQLRTQVGLGMQAISEQINFHKLTDDQLIATWVAYDAEVANENTYVEALKQLFGEYKTFVAPIGELKQEFDTSTEAAYRTGSSVRGMWRTRYDGTQQLVLVSESSSGNALYDREDPPTVVPVPEQMIPFVKTATISRFGKIDTLDPNTEAEMWRRRIEQLEDIRRKASRAGSP